MPPSAAGAAFHSPCVTAARGRTSFRKSRAPGEWTVEEVSEGGQNRFVHKLPTRTRYSRWS